MKVKIQIGTNLIELKGKLSEVQEILDNHWKPLEPRLKAIENLESTNTASSSDTAQKTANQGAKSKSKKQNGAGKTKNAFNPEEKEMISSLVKHMKTHIDSKKYWEIARNGHYADKVFLPMYLSDFPLSPGLIILFYKELKINSNSNSMRNPFNNNPENFIKADSKDSNGASLYELTHQARENFESKINLTSNE